MPSAAAAAAPMGRPGGAFSNGIRMSHACLLLLFLFLRHGLTFGAEQPAPPHGGGHGDDHLREGGEEGEEGGHHGYQVFHVDFERVQLPFIISLWIFVSSLAKIGFHMTPKLHHIFPESCLLIVVGIVIGFLLILTSEEVPTTLTPDTFFLFMLPPIILDAGYFMPNRLFFDHLGTILLMAVVGTIFNMLTIGASLYACGLSSIFGDDPPDILETFLFASLVVAVDPVAVLAVFEEIHVDEILYIIVFGESLLNDAVTVVLYNMFDAYVEIGKDNIVPTDIFKGIASFLVVGLGGTIIGIIWGYVTGFVTRFTNHARVLEPLFVFVMAYMSYLNAETFHLSGILAITFCGITMKNYVERNISSKSQTTLKYAMKMLSGSSETIIFMFLGVATVHDDHEWNWAFVVLTILFCSFFRVVGVILQCAIANRYRLHKLKVVDQFVMMYGGLRGAVAFALVLLIDKKKVPHAPMFVTTTIAVIYWTVFVQGITIKPLVKFLNVKTSSNKDPTMNERIAGRFMDHVVSGMEGILGELGNLRMRDMYKYFDTKYIKPCLLRENQYRDPKIIETFENLTNRDAVEFMKRNPTQFAGLKSMAEMAALGDSTNTLNKLSSSNGTSHANLENLDMKHMVYSPSQKDLTESKIHHLLTENLFMPRARPRRMSYSRHAVNETDLSMQHDVNYRVHMQVRRMLSENRAARRRKQMRRLVNGADLAYLADENLQRTRVTFETEKAQGKGQRVSGSAKQLKDEHMMDVINKQHGSNEDIMEEDEEGGICFTPHNSTVPLSGGLSNPAYVRDLYDNAAEANRGGDDESDDDDGDGGGGGGGGGSRGSSDHVRPTQTEQTLPWKRNSDEKTACEAPIKQREFPAWLKNEEYMHHMTPSNEMLGVVADPNYPSSPSGSHYSNVDPARRSGTPGALGVPGSFDFEEPPSSASRGETRRNSEAEYQEKPPMVFPHAGSGAGSRRSSLSKQARPLSGGSSVHSDGKKSFPGSPEKKQKDEKKEDGGGGGKV